ncbi:MAG: hypothetical protein PHG02_04820 [Oscillospiraceae bacterium]|nr:hypothetical protein [Oscillospiraceae bacterium]
MNSLVFLAPNTKEPFTTSDIIAQCADDLTPQLEMRLIDKTNIYFENEQNPDINGQGWLIIEERVSVHTIKQEAEKNGIPASDIALISSDEETQTYLGVDKDCEVKTDDGKCTALLYMRKTTKGIAYCRSTKSVIYGPEQTIPGLDVYPVVGMRWEEKVGDSRGVGAVNYMIPSQIEVNRTAARRAIAVKRFSFPTLVYDEGKITNIADLDRIGANIALSDMRDNPINTVIGYLNPAPISADAANLQNELMSTTRELEGAGSAATGDIDPTQASGEAIKAARDQAAVPLNDQVSSYKQFIEDVALLWFKMWVAYSPNGMLIKYQRGDDLVNQMVPADILQDMDISIKIDVSPVDPYSKLSQESGLSAAMAAGNITFEEYVAALDDSSSMPKTKLQEIISNRVPADVQNLLEAVKNDPQLQSAISTYLQQNAVSDSNTNNVQMEGAANAKACNGLF